MEIARYVALCTRLSRFVQLQTLSTDDAASLCATCSEFMAFYAQEEQQQTSAATTNAFSLLGGVSSATMDDIVLLTMQKLLLGVVTSSESRVKEGVFQVLARVLVRNALKIRAFNEQKLLGFLQSCVLYLPTPDAALDRSNASEKQQPASKALQIQSEELRLHILTSLQLLMSNRASDLRLNITSAAPSSGTEQMHFFAYVVSALLHIGEHDRCRPAAKLAVETLALLMDFLHDPDLLRQFFPGVSVGMWKTINAPHQSSKVAVAALRCLAQSIKLCISDSVIQNSSSSISNGASSFTIEALRALALQTDEVKQSATESKQDAWLQETAVNVDIVLSKLFASIQVAHKSWRIREALVELCGAVVLSSRVTLRESFFRCYEELLVLRVDSISEVSASAQQVISALQDELSTDEWLQMVPVLADRFQMHLSTLSLKCSTDHESASVSLMRKLIGYVSFLGKRLGAYLDASMDAIYAALCRVLEFDAIDIDLVLHQKYIDVVDNVENEDDKRAKALTTSQFQKRLRFFHEEESVKTTTQLLLAIGSISTPALFIDCAFTLLASEGEDAGDVMMEERHAEVFLVLNGFLKAYVKTSHGGLDTKDTPHQLEDSQEQNGVDVHLVGRILEDLLVLDAWSEHSDHRHNNNSSTQVRTRRSLKAAVAQRALMVECVGICVEILHRDFGIFLLHTLYPLVEKLGSRDVEVEHAALAALHKVYFFCGYASVEALFEANMDYFVDALCSRLEHLEAYPLTALVVEGLLRHTKIASLPLVDEVANSLLRSVDLYQDSPYISSLLRALKLLLSSMTASGDTFEKPKRQSPDGSENGGGPMTRQQTGSLLSQFIKEICILSNEKVGYEDDESDNSAPAAKQAKQEEDTSDEAKMKGAMPVEYDERSALDGPREGDDGDQPEEDVTSGSSSRYTALIVEILDRSGHFLSESEPIACCLVLSIIEEGVLLLRRSRKELLPLIHRLWGSLLHRLEVTNKPIVTATIRLVSTLALVAGDFIGERFVENVWPAVRRHLRNMELLTEKKSTTTQVTRSMLLLDASGAQAQVAGETSDLRAEQPQEPTSHRRTQDSQLLVAALECLATVCNKSSAVTFIVPEVAAATKKYLSAHFPPQVVHASKQLLVALGDLNGDEVFCALAPLADWTPPRPPSARFPAFTADATRQFYKVQAAASGAATAAPTTSAASRENAACLIRQLVRNQ
ncbi:hypothetical protein Gpo141_00000130 [Globisporangium polare]